MAGKKKAKGGPRGGSLKATDKDKGGKDGKDGKQDKDKKDNTGKGNDKGDHYGSDTVAIILKRDCAEALYAALVVALGTLPTPKKKKKNKKDKKDKGKDNGKDKGKDKGKAKGKDKGKDKGKI